MGVPPFRPRTPSGHDIPIPESVFQALGGLQHSIAGLTAEVRSSKADTDARLAAQDKTLADLKAGSADRWVNMIKVLIPAVATIIGGTVGVQKLTAPEPPAATRVVRSADDLRLDECRPLQPGSYERAECFERVSGVTKR